MKKVFNQAKEKFSRVVQKSKKVVAAALIGGTAVAFTSRAGAATDMTSVTTSIDTQFGDIVTAALVVLGSVAGAALILFGGIYAWKYGKKVFSVISK